MDGAAIPGIVSQFVKGAIAELAGSVFSVTNYFNMLDYLPVGERANFRAGTSTYDCTTGIINAVAASVGAGKWLYSPAGQYPFSGEIVLPTNCRVFGDGYCTDGGQDFNKQTWFKATTTSAWIRVGVANATGSTASRQIQLRDFCIDANNLGKWGIICGFVNRCYLDAITVWNVTDTGFIFAASQNSTMRRLNTTSCPRSYGVHNGAQNLWFYDCTGQGKVNGNTTSTFQKGLGQIAQTAYKWRHVLVSPRSDVDFFNNDPASTLASDQIIFYNGIHDYGQGIYTVEVDYPGCYVGFVRSDFTGKSAYSTGTPYFDDPGSGTSPAPASMYVGNGSTVFWDGTISAGNAAPGCIIENHGQLILGPTCSVSNDNPGWLPAGIKNFGTVLFGYQNNPEPPNMLRPEFSFFGGNTGYYGNIAVGQKVNPTGSNAALTFDTTRQRVNVAVAAPGVGNSGVTFGIDTDDAYQNAQGTIHKIRLCIESSSGGSGLVDISEGYTGQGSGNPATLPIITGVGPGVYEFFVAPTYYSGVNYFTNLRITSSTAGATAFVVAYVVIQNVGRAGA